MERELIEEISELKTAIHLKDIVISNHIKIDKTKNEIILGLRKAISILQETVKLQEELILKKEIVIEKLQSKFN